MLSIRVLVVSFVLIGWASRACAEVFITGQLTSKTTGGPTAGVAVSATDASAANPGAAVTAQSLANGSFLLRVPAPGHYHLSLNGQYAVAQERDIVVPPTGLADVNFQLEFVFPLRLRILAADGVPVLSAPFTTEFEVTWDNGNGNGYGSSNRVDHSGLMQFAVPTQNSVEHLKEIVITLRSARYGCGQIHIKQWPTDILPLQLQSREGAAGAVQDEHGAPVPGVVVTATMNANQSVPSYFHEPIRATTDAAGRFSLPALFPGSYLVRVNLPGVSPQIVAVPSGPLLFQQR